VLRANDSSGGRATATFRGSFPLLHRRSRFSYSSSEDERLRVQAHWAGRRTPQCLGGIEGIFVPQGASSHARNVVRHGVWRSADVEHHPRHIKPSFRTSYGQRAGCTPCPSRKNRSSGKKRTGSANRTDRADQTGGANYAGSANRAKQTGCANCAGPARGTGRTNQTGCGKRGGFGNRAGCASRASCLSGAGGISRTGRTCCTRKPGPPA
jgi:hypothetical protein